MDFMNLNQAAHGDRKYDFIGACFRKLRKVIAGFWQDEEVQGRIGSWMKAAVGMAVSKFIKGYKRLLFGAIIAYLAMNQRTAVIFLVIQPRPLADTLQNRHNGFSPLRQGVLHPGRNFTVGFPRHNLGGDQLLQRRRQNGVRDVPHLFAQLAVPLTMKFVSDS